MHTAAHRVPAGFLTAMESTWPERHRQTGLTIVADMINHRGEAGSEFCKKLDDFVKPLVHRIKAGPHGSIVRRDRTTVPLRVAFEHPVQVLRLPPEGRRQGLKRARLRRRSTVCRWISRTTATDTCERSASSR